VTAFFVSMIAVAIPVLSGPNANVAFAALACSHSCQSPGGSTSVFILKRFTTAGAVMGLGRDSRRLFPPKIIPSLSIMGAGPKLVVTAAAPDTPIHRRSFHSRILGILSASPWVSEPLELLGREPEAEFALAFEPLACASTGPSGAGDPLKGSDGVKLMGETAKPVEQCAADDAMTPEGVTV